MKAYRIRSQTTIDPFGDDVSTIPVCNKEFSVLQDETLKNAGFERVETPPKDEAYLCFSDRIWFTEALLHAMKNKIGRLQCSDALWASSMHALQELDEDDCYEIAIVPPGSVPEFASVPPLNFDWGLRDSDPLDLHPSMQHAQKKLRVGPIMVHQIHHWSHILRINQLAIANIGESIRLKWKNANVFLKVWMAMGFLLRVRSFKRELILARMGERGKNCQIHPTAVVEACQIGNDVVIGPYAVVRASVIGDGVKIEEYATVNISIIGAGSRINRYSLANLCVFYDRVMISHGCGYQATVFGRDAFAAWDVTALDLSFGKSVKVLHHGEWVDSGQHFLGAAIGHGALLGNRVRLKFGVSVPNNAVLIGPITDLIRDASMAEPGVPYSINAQGELSSIRQVQPKKPHRD